MAWKLALGNLITRVPATPQASGSSENPLYPLADIGNGYPDEPSRWNWDADGGYGATFDLNLLATSSPRVDAPSGWSDLANVLAGTPGLGANPPEWGTWATRANSLKVYGPVFQDIEVMPGEDLLFEAGLYRETGTSATGVKVVIINLTTGKKYDGVDNEWNDDADAVAQQTTLDTWLDVSEAIPNVSSERVTYRVILTPTGGTGSGYYVYISTPALTAEQDFAAIVGHNLPAGATVTWADGTVTRTFTYAQPSMYVVGTASSKRNWTLTITMPTNSKDWQASPFVGELWAGRLVDMVACPGYPFDVLEGDLGQVRLLGGLGHESVYTETERPNRLFTLKFKSNSTAYADARDNFLRASRFGADPVLLVPVDALEGAGTIWHGRVGPDTTYSLINRTQRTFEVKLRESPWPRFR